MVFTSELQDSSLGLKVGKDEYFYEHELVKHLYGHLLTLATRPFSTGNTLAIDDAVSDVKFIIAELTGKENSILAPEYFEMIKSIISLSNILPVNFVSQTLIKGIYQQLCNQTSQANTYPLVHYEEFSSTIALKNLIVHVGPTIGLGDELILANALAQRLTDQEVTLYISTKRFGLWNFLPVRTVSIGDSSCAHVKFIECNQEYERVSTGYLFVDFLEEPCRIPIYIPNDLLFTASWIFGKSQCVIVDSGKKKVHFYKYPEYAIANRSIESSWIANKLFSTSPAMQTNLHVQRKVSSSKRKSILVQLLTSKPQLLLNPSFFNDSIQKVFRCANEPFDIRIINGPNKDATLITSNFYESLKKKIPEQHVILLPITDTHGIVREINESTVVFGPDTFTSHIAAFRNIIQVTVHLKEHKSWLNICSPSLYIELNNDFERTKNTAIDRLMLLFTSIGQDLTKNRKFFEDMQSWCDSTMYIYRFVAQVNCIAGLNKRLELKDMIRKIKELLFKYNNLSQELFFTYQTSINMNDTVVHFDLDDYRNEEDLVLALSKWITIIGSSELSGIFFCLNNMYINDEC